VSSREGKYDKVGRNGSELSRMQNYHRHDLSDEAWEWLEGKLPGRRGMWGGIVQDNRRFINGVFWILRTGAPWRDLPPDYGDWKNTHRRFSRWRDKGIWEKPLESLRRHWAIENQLHWALDVIFDQDSSNTRKDMSPLNLNILRKTALALFKHANLRRRLSIQKKRFCRS